MTARRAWRPTMPRRGVLGDRRAICVPLRVADPQCVRLGEVQGELDNLLGAESKEEPRFVTSR